MTTENSSEAKRGSAAALATTVVFAGFIAVLGVFPGLYVGGGSVPVVLQNAGPLLAGVVLGARRATAAVVLFLALTAIGLPLLSGGRAGVAPFVGPSGGFLFGWILSALVAGAVVTRFKRTGLPVLLLAAALGLLADYAVGVPYLAFYLGDLRAAVVQSLVFLPGDVAKVLAVALIAAVLHRALPGRLAG
ncbi:BioY family transporter [Actinosynnema sp. ALI-1.44]|uniref:biotin transporter BioY n=1 Tax=Actinosynnema sp. ALI-1.44 TaxID=1933779 RepID=UPI00097C03CE|nr:biotin transporter BioY [Actinosynnema sp. ALI-1.44]ONI83172.1 BioY family transporter [Actinosynnema sp. ALI-1.44]